MSSAENEILLVQDVADDEYSTDFFNVTADAVHERVMKTIVPEAITESTARLKKFLLQHCKDHEKEIESAFSVLLNESLSAVPGLSKALKDLTDMNLKIPKTVLLEQDLIQSTQYTEEDVQRMDMEIAAVEGRITKASFMEAYYEEELELAAKFNEVVTGSEAFDMATVLSNSSATIASIPMLKNAEKNFNIKEMKKVLITSKTSHKAGTQAVEQTHSNIYQAPLKWT